MKTLTFTSCHTNALGADSELLPYTIRVQKTLEEQNIYYAWHGGNVLVVNIYFSRKKPGKVNHNYLQTSFSVLKISPIERKPSVWKYRARSDTISMALFPEAKRWRSSPYTQYNIQMMYTWNLYGFINQCDLNKFNNFFKHKNK